MVQAALGCEITITGLDGKKITIKVPDGTGNGKLLRVKGEGVPAGSAGRKGDLYVKIMVQIPTRLSAKQKDLLAQFLAIENPPKEPSLMKLADLS